MMCKDMDGWVNSLVLNTSIDRKTLKHMMCQKIKIVLMSKFVVDS